MRVSGAHVLRRSLLPLTFANGWRATGGGGDAAGRLERYRSVGIEPQTRVSRDRVCERTPFLQATSGNPAEGTMVAVGP